MLKSRYSPGMSTITAILDPDADGTLHLPLPAELRHGKVAITATLEAVDQVKSDESDMELARRRSALEALKRLRARGTFCEISDPVAWQRELRKDRPLSGREE